MLIFKYVDSLFPLDYSYINKHHHLLITMDICYTQFKRINNPLKLLIRPKFWFYYKKKIDKVVQFMIAI